MIIDKKWKRLYFFYMRPRARTTHKVRLGIELFLTRKHYGNRQEIGIAFNILIFQFGISYVFEDEKN